MSPSTPPAGGARNSISCGRDAAILGGICNGINTGGSSGIGVITGGRCNGVSISNGSAAILGGNCNCVSNFFGGTVISPKFGFSYLNNMVVTNSGYGAASLAEYQSSKITPYLNKSFTSASSNCAGLMGGIVNSGDPIIPTGTNRSWTVEVSYTAIVTSITGTATGVTVGDTKTQTQILGLKKVGGTLTILSGSPISTTAIEDTSMSTGTMTYSIISGALVPSFTAPTFAGGGSLNIKVNMTMSLTELGY